MEPLLVIGLVGNIVQFVDFSSKLVSKTVEGYRSADGALVDNAKLETVTNDLLTLNARMNSDTATRGATPSLISLCSSCDDVAKELIAALGKLKAQGSKSKWKSFRKALRSVWSKEEVLGIERRLSSFREEINLHVVVDLREQLDIASIQQSDGYKKLEDKSPEMLNLIINQDDVFKSNTQEQMANIKAMHAETNETIIEQHGVTRIEIIEAIQLKAAIQQLCDQMKQKDAELGEILKEFRVTRSQKKKKVLQERSNSIPATLFAIEVMYRCLQAVLKSMQTRARAVIEPLKNSQPGASCLTLYHQVQVSAPDILETLHSPLKSYPHTLLPLAVIMDIFTELLPRGTIWLIQGN